MMRLKKAFEKIDGVVFWTSLITCAAIVVPLLLSRELGTILVNTTFAFITQNFGWAYMITVAICFIFAFWVSAGKRGKVVLGVPGEKPDYGYFSWASMLFTAGVGTGIIVLGFLESIYYLETPPFHIEPFSTEAYEFAHMYGQFHWGLSAWAVYSPAVVAVAYTLFVLKKPFLRMSTACEPVLKGQTHKLPGKLIDVLVMFGILASMGTSMGLGAPVLATFISNVFNLPNTFFLRIVILIILLCIFGTSVFLGLDKGIRNLSNFNIVLAIVFVALIFILGPTVQILKMQVNSTGLYLQNFFHMSFWMDPFGDGQFTENWTVFYWGWWIAFMPIMSLFVARISRGRTIREMVWGLILWGTLGCWVCFGVFGGYSLYLQQNGIVDLAYILQNYGQDMAILAIIQTLPFSGIFQIFLSILCFVFISTTIDSAAYVLASICTKKLSGSEEPARWNRLVWAVMFLFLSISLIYIGGLRTVQTISIVGSVLLIGVLFIVILSVYRMLEKSDPEKEEMI